MHFLCFAAYADLTLVDQRTLENVRRVPAKDAVADRLLARVERAASYSAIPKYARPAVGRPYRPRARLALPAVLA
jgi:hypothetical protein